MTDDSYVHEPGQSTAEPASDAERREAREGFDWRGWTLVGVVIFCFVVAPLLVWLSPAMFPFEFSYLVLPMLPALLLGATAVWAAVRSRQ